MAGRDDPSEVVSMQVVVGMSDQSTGDGDKDERALREGIKSLARRVMRRLNEASVQGNPDAYANDLEVILAQELYTTRAQDIEWAAQVTGALAESWGHAMAQVGVTKFVSDLVCREQSERFAAWVRKEWIITDETQRAFMALAATVNGSVG